MLSIGLLAFGLLLAVNSALHSYAEPSPNNEEEPFLVFPKGGLGPHTANISNEATVREKYFAQKVDHFAKNNNATFQQRYLVNKKYAKGNQIHILFLGGHVIASASSVTNENVSYVITAKSLKATVWALETRFFGKSRPAIDTSVKNLALLTINQSVADIADFIKGQNQASGEKNPKWVLYGSFYGGTLALWFRQKYPQLSVGAVASSAIVQLKLDYYPYQRNVESAYYDYSKECGDAIARAVLTVRQLMQYTEGRNRLSDALQLQPPLNSLKLRFPDLQYFFTKLAGLFRYPVQYNKVNVANFGSGGGISDVCRFFVGNTTDDLSKVVNLTNYIMPFLNGRPFIGLATNHTAFKQKLRNEAYNEDGYSVFYRVMYWQDCNELGSSLTTDNGALFFGSTIPNNFFLNMCTDVFGDDFDVSNLKSGLKNTSRDYGSSFAYKGNNTVITIGSVDPWRHAGFNSTTDASSTVYVIKGAAQSADFAPLGANDTAAVREARRVVDSYVKKWVSNKKSNKNLPKPKSTLKIEVLDQTNKVPTSLNKRQEIKNWDTVLHKNLTKPNEEEEDAKLRESAQLPTLFGLLSRIRNLKKRAKAMQLANNQSLEQLSSYYITYNSLVQDVDHFDRSNKDNFTQYYYHSSNYQTSNGPNFLMIGGEGRLSYYEVSSYLSMNTWASDYSAAMYATEHRFYGKSQPKEDLSVENLQWLTSEQALADTAVFINAINKDKGQNKPKWIVFGGSYPGSLAAWFRLKYPELTIGAVASSAPVQAQVDDFEYLQVVSNATRVYGPPSCVHSIHKFFTWAQQQTTTVKGRKGLSQTWSLCDKWDTNYMNDKDYDLILAFYVFFVAEFVQYDDQGHHYVDYICRDFKNIDEQVTASKAEMHERYLNMSRKIATSIKGILKGESLKGVHLDQTGKRQKEKCPSYENYDYDKSCQDDDHSSDYDEEDRFCEGMSYEAYVDMAQQVTPFDSAERGWMWQQCNELGALQSTNMGYNLFESTLPINFYIDLCADVFGPRYTRDFIEAKIRYTNDNYGGQDYYNGTNVVFINGSEDPWWKYGVYAPMNPDSVTSILINGTSHCEDMYVSKYYDKQGLKDARAVIKKNIGKWLST